MNDRAILGHLVMGHSLMIDRDRNVVATRLTVFADRRDAPPDAGALLDAALDVWPMPDGSFDAGAGEADDGPVTLTLRDVAAASTAPAPTAAAASRPKSTDRPTVATPVSLNVASEPWLRALLARRPPPHVMVEVPAFMTADPEVQASLKALHAAGSTLVIKGRPVSELGRDLLPCFRHSIIDVSEERRDPGQASPAGVVRQITHIQTGVNSLAEVDAAFARGAVAVLGWPIDAQAAKSKKPAGPDLNIVMQLMQRVDREEPIDRLEAVLRNDPQLAFRLLRYLNSAAFGLSVEITSFRHALMMLGYKKLKRWLALLLASANPDPSMRPAIHAAVRRGLLMEELSRGSADPETRSEMFICGVFSLLDRMMGQPFSALFDSLPVPESVHQALVHGNGPCVPCLVLARAVESGMRTDIREAADLAFMGMDEVNAALLRALKSARELETA